MPLEVDPGRLARAAPRRSAAGAGSSGSARRCRPARAPPSPPDTAAAGRHDGCADRRPSPSPARAGARARRRGRRILRPRSPHVPCSTIPRSAVRGRGPQIACPRVRGSGVRGPRIGARVAASIIEAASSIASRDPAVRPRPRYGAARPANHGLRTADRGLQRQRFGSSGSRSPAGTGVPGRPLRRSSGRVSGWLGGSSMARQPRQLQSWQRYGCRSAEPVTQGFEEAPQPRRVEAGRIT